MTKEIFLTKWVTDCAMVVDLDAVIATEIAKVQEAQPQPTDKVQISKHTLVEVNRAFRALKQDRNSYIHKVFNDDGVFDAMDEIRKMFDNYFVEQPQEQQPELNQIEQAYERGEKIRAKIWEKGNWAIKSSDIHAEDEKKILWDVQIWNFKTKPELWELYTEPDQVTDQVTDHEQPEMTEKEKIDHILTNKLTWKPMGNKRFYANMFSGKASDGSRQVYFVDYNNPFSGYFETRIFTIDLSEWQPVETEQPAKPFDKERFEAMFRAVVETHEATMNALKQLDAYYATKNN